MNKNIFSKFNVHFCYEHLCCAKILKLNSSKATQRFKVYQTLQLGVGAAKLYTLAGILLSTGKFLVILVD